ncbi:hypothetical protein [Thermomonospora cellulosilytica]|uniref:Uncharacterized protein n=1 Tax=Thermomonospora cellulosilytica TaxID=1411118 RepID=A0A7W3MVC2_9ACTN|nr:hypothetical protein [Thermomonospora cellulosilytica]MBA9002538.1 hypothetical protein [Thermomonospora cellulosilytica]
MPMRRGRMWIGAVLTAAGVAVASGFAFVPPHALIPELVRDPEIRWIPEGLAGFWLAGIGLVVLLSARGGERR